MPAPNKRQEQNMTMEDVYLSRETARRIQAERNAGYKADEIRAAIDGNLYRDDEDDFVCIPDGVEFDEELFAPVSFFEWLNDQLEVTCLFDRNGEPREVSVQIQFGGPSCWTDGNLVWWSHGWDKGSAHVSGMHDALLDLEQPLELVKRDRWGY